MKISLEFQKMVKRMEKRHSSKRQWLWIYYNWRMPVLRHKKTNNAWVLNIPHSFQTACKFRRRKEFVFVNHQQNRVVIMNRRPRGSGFLNGTPRESNTKMSWGDVIWVQEEELAVSIHFDDSMNICWTLAIFQEGHPASGLLPSPLLFLVLLSWGLLPICSRQSNACSTRPMNTCSKERRKRSIYNIKVQSIF